MAVKIRLPTLFSDVLLPYYMRRKVDLSPLEHLFFVWHDHSSFDDLVPCRAAIFEVTNDGVVQPFECQDRAYCPACSRCSDHCDCPHP